LNAEPNAAHKKLAELEDAGRIDAVVTQNIDGLHQRAGSKNVIELHGSAARYYCEKCGAKYGLAFALGFLPRPPVCSCGAYARPDVVMYGEQLDNACLSEAVRRIGRADALIIAGTSLSVYPAAALVRYFKGKSLALINRSPTQMDGAADILLRGSVGEIMKKIIV